MSIKAIVKKVDATKTYNLSNIKDNKLFPWTNDIRTIRKIVQVDARSQNMLKAVVSFEGRSTRYHIKGKHIINFLEKYGDFFILSTKKLPPQ